MILKLDPTILPLFLGIIKAAASQPKIASAFLDPSHMDLKYNPNVLQCPALVVVFRGMGISSHYHHPLGSHPDGLTMGRNMHSPHCLHHHYGQLYGMQYPGGLSGRNGQESVFPSLLPRDKEFWGSHHAIGI